MHNPLILPPLRGHRVSQPAGVLMKREQQPRIVFDASQLEGARKRFWTGEAPPKPNRTGLRGPAGGSPSQISIA